MRTFDFLTNNLSNLISSGMRRRLYRHLGIGIGESSVIRKYGYFETNRVKIGNNSFINAKCNFITGAGDCEIVIGDNVQLGTGVSLICTNHEIGTSDSRAGTPANQSIIIEDGVWIGANVTILSGVTVGQGSVVGAGSLCTRNVEPNCLYYGVPARKIRRLEEEDLNDIPGGYGLGGLKCLLGTAA